MAQSNPFQDYLRVQRKYDREIMRILEQAARDVRQRINKLSAKDTFSARIRAAQFRVVLEQIEREQASMWSSIGRTTQAGRKAAAEAAQESLEVISRVAYASLTPDAAELLTASLEATARAGINNAYARVPRELSQKVYRTGVLETGKINDLIRQGLVQGLSAKELAGTVYQYISPTTPGGASYAAMRLARTEINNAFHEQQINAADAPGVTGVKWSLSSSHPRPDECNALAERNSYKLGAGVYPKSSVPSKPHPHCFCYLTYITMEPEEFAEALVEGKFDAELRRRAGLNTQRLKDMQNNAGPGSRAASEKRARAAKQRTVSSGAEAKP